MGIVSYAQNREDVVLWRALNHIPKGLYIDVGANDPVQDSITKAFYDVGWSGINIEPLPDEFAKLADARPRDVNLQVAISSSVGHLNLWDFGVRGWATGSPKVYEQRISEGHSAETITVAVRTLTDICEEFVDSDIHFLKIDVEGMEDDVIDSIDLTVFRPWVIVIEATQPDTAKIAKSSFDRKIINFGYRRAQFDGLNIFYVSNEHLELLDKLKTPANVLDQYMINESELLKQNNDELGRQIRILTAQCELAESMLAESLEASELLKRELSNLHMEGSESASDSAPPDTINELVSVTPGFLDHVERVQAWASDLNEELTRSQTALQRVHESRSWRITRPLRLLTRIFKGDLTQISQLVGRLSQTKNLPEAPVQLKAQVERDHFFNPEFIVDEIVKDRYAGKKIAVLAVVSPDGVAGGAERFYLGLTNSLRAFGCDVELLSIPVDEGSFEGIQDAYRTFERLDLSPYDCVISTKAPSFAIFHHNHITYLVHTVRAFYDMFDASRSDPTGLRQREWIVRTDTNAIGRSAKIFAIGHEVAARLAASSELGATVLHPPLNLKGLHFQCVGDFFFMPGRLHPWKRVDLAIRAVLESRLPMKLVIAGEGEAEPSLKELANGDQRIEFIGSIPDNELYEYYAKCLAVPFLPIREDYGYVTLEAFASGKPVVTCKDSGEPSRIVVDEETGLVAEPSARSLTAAFERLWNDRQLAADLGANARLFNAGMSWKNVAAELLGAAFDGGEKLTARTKVAVLDMQPITPPVGGGRVRLLGLYHDLGPGFETRYIGSYDWPGERRRDHALTATLTESTIPLSAEHHAAAARASKMAGGKTVIDLLFGKHAHLSTEYLQAVRDAVRWADVVVFSHPWVMPLVPPSLLENKFVVYDAQNCEGRLRSALLDPSDTNQRDVIDYVSRSERSVGDRADLVLACSQEDKSAFIEDYAWVESKIKLVPNGVFFEKQVEEHVDRRRRSRLSLGLSQDDFVAFFLGSNYKPNVDAAAYIIGELSAAVPSCNFVVAGGCTAGLVAETSNCRVVAQLSDEEKKLWLSAADIALNPMFSGSGTNVKMFEYMANSLPIVSTAVGARGICGTSSRGITVVEDNLAQGVRDFADVPLSERLKLGRLNREWAMRDFNWHTISRNLGRSIERLTASHFGGANSSSRVAHLGTIGHRCGIGEYGRNLVRALERRGAKNLILTCSYENATIDIAEIPQPAHVVWHQDNETWRYGSISEEAIHAIVEWQADRLIIQYHPGFYAASDIESLVRQARHRNIRADVRMAAISRFADTAP